MTSCSCGYSEKKVILWLYSMVGLVGLDARCEQPILKLLVKCSFFKNVPILSYGILYTKD